MLTPQYWPFWIGLVLVVIVLVGRERITSWTTPFRRLASHLNWRAIAHRIAALSSERPLR